MQHDGMLPMHGLSMFSGFAGLPDTLYLLSGHVLFVGFWLAGSAKATSLDAQGPDRGTLRWLEAMVQSKAFSALQLALALGMVLPIPGAVQVTVHVLGVTIVGLGMLLRVAAPKRSCRCFGAFTPKRSGMTSLLQAGMFLSLLFRLLVDPALPMHVAAAYPTMSWLPGVLFALALSSHAGARTGLPAALRSDAVPGTVPGVSPAVTAPRAASPSMPPGVVQPPVIKTIDPALQLGVGEEGQVVTVADVVQAGRPLFITGFHDNCEGCRRLLPDYCALAEAFGADFPMVALTNRRDLVPETPGLITVVDEGHRINRELGIDFSPFGLLVNGADFRVMAPPAGGENAIRMLFAITLNARLPSKVK